MIARFGVAAAPADGRGGERKVRTCGLRRRSSQHSKLARRVLGPVHQRAHN